MNDPETFYHQQLLKRLPVSWNQHGSSNEIKYQAVQSLPGPMPMKTVSLPKLPPSLPVKAQMTRLRLKHYFCWANGMCFCFFFLFANLTFLLLPCHHCHQTHQLNPHSPPWLFLPTSPPSFGPRVRLGPRVCFFLFFVRSPLPPPITHPRCVNGPNDVFSCVVWAYSMLFFIFLFAHFLIQSTSFHHTPIWHVHLLYTTSTMSVA